MQTRELESAIFVEAMADIERLNGLARSAFHEVVERGHHHHPIRERVALESDVAIVAAGDYFRLRVAVNTAALLHDSHERLVLVGRPVDRPDLLVFERLI